MDMKEMISSSATFHFSLPSTDKIQLASKKNRIFYTMCGLIRSHGGVRRQRILSISRQLPHHDFVPDGCRTGVVIESNTKSDDTAIQTWSGGSKQGPQ